MGFINRRSFIAGAGGLALLGGASGAYAVGVEPNFILKVQRYRISPPGWPAGLTLKLAVIADIHACEPFMSAARIAHICALANSLNPDAVALLGDFNGGHNFVTGAVGPQQIGEALAHLRAPLGCYAVLGNHDWLHGALPRLPSDGTRAIRRALRQAGVRLLENDAVALVKNQHPFWIAGLGDQLANPRGDDDFNGVDDLPGTLAKVTDNAPLIMLAHEPMIFSATPPRVALTLCGHTHGGQVNLPLFGPVAGERRFGSDLVYGHIVKDDRHLVISAGLGESQLPMRFMRPPELVEIILTADAPVVATR